MTTRVGVRELQNEAPRLVKRALRGERIVVTRYGRDAAQLVALDPREARDTPSSARTAWSRERAAFQKMRVRLSGRFDGEFVAIHRGRVVGHGMSVDRLYERLQRKLGDRPFFIGRVGGRQPIADMPGLAVE